MREPHKIRKGPANLGSLRLEPGSHASPGDGVCIVELASLMGGERFSDHPGCVCEVIAAFLRGWNDRSSHADRQRLRPYAARIVGSRAEGSVTRTRRDICLSWAGADLTGGRVRASLRRLAMRFRVFVLCGLGPALRLNQGAGELASRVVFARYGPEAGFSVIDALLEVGSEPGSAPVGTNGWGANRERPAHSTGTQNGRDPALARSLVERIARDSGSGAPPASTNGARSGNGASPESGHGSPPGRESRRAPVDSA
jgi:hypothetical protein